MGATEHIVPLVRAGARIRRPSLADISAAQEEDVNLRRQLAARRFYTIAKRAFFCGLAVTVALALVAPVVRLVVPGVGPGLGAVAGAWIFVARLLLEPFKRRYQQMGAQAQELFDCAVLGTGWNDALAKSLSEEEVRKASRDMSDADDVRDWYPTDSNAGWPTSVLICQRSNAVWSRRQHRAYSTILAVAAAVWSVVGVVVAVADGASLGEYLATIALPSLPAVLDAAEMSRSHREASDRRGQLEARTAELLDAESVSAQDLREVQDQLFDLRQEGPLIPDRFYRRLKDDYERDMRYAAALAAQTPGKAAR